MNLSDLMNTPRLYTALAEWGACLLYILMQKRRITGWKLPFALAGALCFFIIYHHIAGLLPLYLWIPGMIGAILAMYALIHGICDTIPIDAGFCCIRAFVLAEFTASLHWQLYVWWVVTFGKEQQLLSFISMILVYTVSFILFYLLEKNYFPKDERLNLSRNELSGAAIIAITAFAISNLSFVMPNTPFSSSTYSILYVRTLVDFGGLLMLLSQQNKREQLRMRSENQAINNVLQHQYNQYRLSVDNMEILRKEFHDLKHYLIAIRSEQDPHKKEQYLAEMEEAILTQEALSNTGNSVLDVVLTNKSIYCVQNHINFTCMADGKLVSFMHVKDICSLFGNALDNAIECVSQFSVPDKRTITLSMYKRNSLLMIQFENYTETSLNIKRNGLPVTTKSDKQLHGYGLKSIKQAAQKYNGTMTLHSDNHWFTLRVLIPVKDDPAG